MTATIAHRGPDDDGFYQRPGVAIGMRRLSIIDVAGGHQPLATEDGTVQVILNGEIYNFQELRRGLIDRGHRLVTRSYTEVLAHLYEETGADLASKLRGMFAFAIWDEKRERLVLGRDRFGKKPLYYAQTGSRFLFGSEIKALLAAEPALATANEDIATQYFRFGFIAEPATIFCPSASISASVMVLSRGCIVTAMAIDFLPGSTPLPS